MRLARYRAIVATLACFLFLSPALGQASIEGPPILELRDGRAEVELLPFSLVHFERSEADAPGHLGFLPDRSLFMPFPAASLRGYIDAKAVWLCLTLRDASSRPWIIAAGPKFLDSVSLYAVGPDGSAESLVAEGDSRSSELSRLLSAYVFRLDIGPGQIKTLYLRFASKGLLGIDARLWDSYDYLQAHEAESVVFGLLLGVIIAVFLYTFLIAFSLRAGIYAPYLLYLVGLLFLVTAGRGGLDPIARIGGTWGAERALPFFASIMEMGMALFARSYLDLKRRSALISRALLAVATAELLSDAGLVFLDLRTATLAAIGLEAVARLVVLASAIYAAGAGGGLKERMFLASWICACFGALLSRLGAAGIPVSAFSPPWGRDEDVGALAQIVILSYGITHAINSIRKEREEGQRRSIELLERANKVKEDFVIGTSLEFRSPLLGIVGLVDAIEDLASGETERTAIAGAEAPEVLRLAALVKAEAQRLLGSVANIAAYVRLRNGDLALVAERVSLREVVEGAAGSASHIALGKDIGVEKAVEDAEIGTDGRVLHQIVFNLLAGAFKRSASGIVRIEGGVEGDRARLAILDSAPELPEEVLLRFRDQGRASGPEAVGPGLDLLVARLLAESLGGSLDYSWAEGHGRFDLELPRECSWRRLGRATERGGLASMLGRLASKGLRPARAELSETSGLKGARGLVLAYDEDPVFLQALKRYLEGRGYAVAPSLSADKAVAMVSSRRFDMVLLDASDRARSGLAACARIRALRGMEELPIVVMTDRDSAEAVEAAFRAGASDYLPKLSPKELLFARVDTHVALRKAMEEALETRKRVAELEKLKTLGVLAAGVAHEVNTPNNAVIRNLPLVSEVWRELAPILKRLIEETEGFQVRGWSADELMVELPELLADTYKAGLQIKKIVEDLKDYARDSSLAPPEPVDLSSVAAYAARLLQPLVGRSTRRFALDAPPGLPQVEANFQKLTQVAVSVLENALQSLPDPEAGVTLRTRFDAGRDRLVLECEDEGCGIRAEILDRIFEPFFTTKREEGGTGLGLSVAVGIVRDSGGEIEVESRPGKGTSVRVVLPAIKAPRGEVV